MSLFFSSQARISGPASPAALPLTERPFASSAPGQRRRMSASLRPMPLPSLVHSGRMRGAPGPRASRKLQTGIGIVPHQQG